jgi:peptidoglycan/LPS O-acetylase OafA/YrhL
MEKKISASGARGGFHSTVIPCPPMTDPSPAPVTTRFHFPGLNALRFYAALAVVFSHIDQNVTPRPFFAELIKPFLIDSNSAVNLFFVLSGFLITYLLLREQAVHGQVSVRKFYLRRALRIWPLYYLVASIGLLLFPFVFGPGYKVAVFYPEYPLMGMPIAAKLALVFCLLPNLAGINAPMSHIWSIGVEEQFYVAWPWVARNKLNILKACIGILILKFVLVLIIPFLYVDGAMKVFNELRFECMAVGALGAYAYCEGSPRLSWCYHPAAQLLALATLVVMAGRHIAVNPYAATGTAVAFIVLILNVATNPRSLVKLDHPVLERLGQISYGLYLYHFPLLFVLLQLAGHFGLSTNTFVYPTALFIATLAGTWLVAEVSYRWFEKPFLDLKERFTIVRT